MMRGSNTQPERARWLTRRDVPHIAFLRPGPSKRPTPASSFATANRQALAFVYFEDEPGRRTAAKLLTRDEALRIAANAVMVIYSFARKQANSRTWPLLLSTVPAMVR